MYQGVIKRALDIIMSAIGIIITAIPMFLISVIIRIDSPGPALFTQKRIGINKTIFKILKFRSMPMGVSNDIPTHLLKDDVELTKWQMFLRKSSLDELPQLFCIFTGKMSFVGPRPALWNQDDLVEERDKYGANNVKPGLTGWAQINGRDNLTIPEKARLDGEYAEAVLCGGKKAFVMDVRCFFGSFLPVLRQEGVSKGGSPIN